MKYLKFIFYIFEDIIFLFLHLICNFNLRVIFRETFKYSVEMSESTTRKFRNVCFNCYHVWRRPVAISPFTGFWRASKFDKRQERQVPRLKRRSLPQSEFAKDDYLICWTQRCSFCKRVVGYFDKWGQEYPCCNLQISLNYTSNKQIDE